MHVSRTKERASRLSPTLVPAEGAEAAEKMLHENIPIPQLGIGLFLSPPSWRALAGQNLRMPSGSSPGRELGSTLDWHTRVASGVIISCGVSSEEG